MTRLLLLAAVLVPPALSAPARADTLPALFDVTGVAAGDALNIREAPSARAAILGRLAPDATGVEGVAARDGWMQVNVAERSGWVSARHLVPAGAVWTSGLPPTLNCGGTEPFWSLTQAPGGLNLRRPTPRIGAFRCGRCWRAAPRRPRSAPFWPTA